MLEATTLVQDIILPETEHGEIANSETIPKVKNWVLTGKTNDFERHKIDGLPALEAGEVYALGLI